MLYRRPPVWCWQFKRWWPGVGWTLYYAKLTARGAAEFAREAGYSERKRIPARLFPKGAEPHAVAVPTL